nr:hypothetical protein [uncultured Cellulosilyticum sp.]
MHSNEFSEAIRKMLYGENEYSESAKMMYKLFTAYQEAGFTEDQAMQLVLGISALSVNANKNKRESE